MFKKKIPVGCKLSDLVLAWARINSPTNFRFIWATCVFEKKLKEASLHLVTGFAVSF